MHFTYLLIDFFTVIVCFIFSFHPKIQFSRHFGAFFKASVLVGLVFIIWDIWFTKNGVWWFNDDYLLGIRLFGLPIEEILFFICIPFSCVFTYFCLDKFFKLDWKPLPEKLYVIFSIIAYLSVAFVFYDRVYTLVTFLTLAFSLITLYYYLGVRWIGKVSFIYLILSPGFLSVNGILTGTGLETPIVNYNPYNFIGFRILTIPIEDFFYGLALILWNVFFLNKFMRKDHIIPSKTN